jgi:Surface antigen variable number repeat
MPGVRFDRLGSLHLAAWVWCALVVANAAAQSLEGGGVGWPGPTGIPGLAPPAGLLPPSTSDMNAPNGPLLAPVAGESGPSLARLQPPPEAPQPPVVDVLVKGNQAIGLERIKPLIRTRAGRPFDGELVEDDVRRMNKSRLFVNVNTRTQAVQEGVVVIFEVVERPTIRTVQYVGASVKKRHLDKQTNLKPGDAMDPYAINEARDALEKYYREKGFSHASVKATSRATGTRCS